MHCMHNAGSALVMSGEPSGNVLVAAIDFEWLHLCKIILFCFATIGADESTLAALKLSFTFI